MQEHFDVAVIGAGPGGYVAAIRCAQHGRSVLVVDSLTNPDNGDAAALGGTCANIGCIPSKAMLAASDAFEKALHGQAVFGVPAQEVTPNLEAVQKHRADTVLNSNRGVGMLFKKNKITFVAGTARFAAKTDNGWGLSITRDGSETTVVAQHVIIACGTTARELPGCPFDEETIVSSTGALRFTEVPKTFGIIGAGVIGLELGTVWRRFGSKVVIFEAMNDLLPMADESVSKEARKILSKQGLEMNFGVRVQSVTKTAEGVVVAYTDAEGKECTQTVDKLMVAIGRASSAASVNPAAVGLELDQRGYIVVDEQCRTNLENVWAIGDVVRGPQLAHKASDEGVAVADRIAGQAAIVHLERIPSVVYTEPEIAWVGMTTKQAKEAGINVKTAQVPFMANGRARAQVQTQGFVKVVVDGDTDRLIGVHIVGAAAAELLGEACAAIAFGATAEDLALVTHAHPTYSESLREACLAARGEAINM